MDYTKISSGVILRDYTEIDYLNDNQKMLIDIADCLFNTGLPITAMTKDAQNEYAKHPSKFWDDVTADMIALSSQVTRNNYPELLAEYNS